MQRHLCFRVNRVDFGQHLWGEVGSISRQFDGTLESIQNADSRGTALVTPQVNDINNSLVGAEQDLFNINLQLQEVNRHLTNICTSPLLSVLPPFKCHP